MNSNREVNLDGRQDHRSWNHFDPVACSGLCYRNRVARIGVFCVTFPCFYDDMDFVHSAVGRRTACGRDRPVRGTVAAGSESESQTPPFLLTLDLRSSAEGGFTRVAEVRGESPEVCAEFVGKLLKVSQLGLSHQNK